MSIRLAILFVFVAVYFALLMYSIGFAMLAFLPRWRWFLPASGGTFWAVWWLLQGMVDAVNTEDSPGVLVLLGVGFPIVAFLTLGLLAGFVGRVIVLVLAANNWPPRPILLPCYIVILLVGSGGFFLRH